MGNGNVSLVLITQTSDALEESIRSRCVKIRMSRLTAKELPELVQRACKLKAVPYDPEYVKILNRGDVRTPRSVLNFVDAVSLGVDPMQAVIAQR